MASKDRTVSAQDLVSHVRRRVRERNRLQQQLATLPLGSPQRAHAAARLTDVLQDLDDIRELVRTEETSQ